MNIVILLGAPGAGKGSSADQLSVDGRFTHVSTGEMLREAIRSGSETGRRATACMDAGELVPDELITRIVVDRLDAGHADERFLLDGFPRTLVQAELLEASLAERGLAVHAVFFLDAPRHLLERRLSTRLTCRDCGAVYNTTTLPADHDGSCGRCDGVLYQREDDNLETIRHRLEVFDRQTVNLVEHYERRGELRRVDASGSVAEMTAQIEAALSEASKP